MNDFTLEELEDLRLIYKTFCVNGADNYEDWTEYSLIQKILPHVTKIEF